MHWMEQANCASTDPDLFESKKGRNNPEAKRVCGRCDVREECAAYAIPIPDLRGIWAGLSEAERKKLRKAS